MLSSIKEELICTFRYLTFQPDPEIRGVCKVKLFASMFIYVSFPLIWYATWPHLEFILPFHSTRVCVRTKYVVACRSKLHLLNLICGMTTFRKKSFWFFTSPEGRGCIQGQNMCLHDAMCSIPLYLKCSMITFRKNVLTIWPRGVCKDRICACLVLYVPFY